MRTTKEALGFHADRTFDITVDSATQQEISVVNHVHNGEPVHGIKPHIAPPELHYEMESVTSNASDDVNSVAWDVGTTFNPQGPAKYNNLKKGHGVSHMGVSENVVFPAKHETRKISISSEDAKRKQVQKKFRNVLESFEASPEKVRLSITTE